MHHSVGIGSECVQLRYLNLQTGSKGAKNDDLSESVS